jgi:hypothetical protein
MWQNSAQLYERGFFVPASLSPYPTSANHERLTTISLQSDKLNDNLRVAAGIKTQDDVLFHRIEVERLFRAELDALGNLPRTLLLSNEHCHSRLTAEEDVKSLYSFLQQFSDQFEIIVYIRPQHELAISLYDTAIKVGYRDIDMLPNFSGGERQWTEKRYFDYDALMSRWCRVFGESSLHPIIFARDELKNKNIIHDFFDYIGCDISNLAVPPNENVGLSTLFQVALNAINRSCASSKLNLTPRQRTRLIELFQNKSRGGKGQRPSRSDAMAFFASFAESNEKVRSRFFPERANLFEVNFDGYPEHRKDVNEVDVLAECVYTIAGLDE